jgi:serine protease Do
MMLLAAAALAEPPEAINLRKTVTVNVVAQAKDAVVNISTTKMVARRVSPFGADPFWQQFDAGGMVKVPANSLGSGFIIHRDGYVVTNHHVIDRARQIVVEMADGRKLPADLISSDAEADLAVLKIDSDKPLPTLPLGDSADLMIGEPVIAVGNPLGFSHSVSTGIVSANHRDLKDERGKTMLGDLMQTDAAINPGNSGGPLLNAYGQVIGINTAVRGDAQNIGFAIQVNKLRDMIPELMNPAQVKKVDLPLKLKEQRRVDPPATIHTGVYLHRNLPTESMLIDINGQKPIDIVDAYAMLLRVKVGDKVKVGYQPTTDSGDHKPKPAEMTLEAKAVPPSDAVVKARDRLGIEVEALTPAIAEKNGVGTDDGILITSVKRDSIAWKTQLKPGDVIVQLGRYRVSTMEDLAALLQHLPDKGRVRIGIIRGDQAAFGMLEF